MKIFEVFDIGILVIILSIKFCRNLGTSKVSHRRVKRPPHNGLSDSEKASGDSDSSIALQKITVVPRKRSAFRSVCLVVTCTGAMIINAVNNTSVSIALPTIGIDLSIQEAKLQWLISSYSISSGCLLLICGRLADLYGRKKVFTMGCLFLAVFSLGCGFAQNQITLDILRAFQGVGSAATIPASIGILAHAFPPSRARSISFAFFASGASIGGALGFAVGGVLTELSSTSWRSNFYLSTGLSALCLFGGLLSIDPDEPSTESDRRVDWPGAFLVTVGLILTVFVLGEGEIAPQQWRTPYIITLLIIGVFMVLLFLLWQRFLENVQNNPNAPHSIFTPPPLMKLSLWTRAKGRFAVIMCIAFLNWSCFMSWTFWVQLYYQDYIGFSPIRTMIRLFPMTVAGCICNLLVAVVVGRLPLVVLIVIGSVLASCASLLFALVVPSASYWAYGFPAAVLSVCGADFVFAGGTIFVAKIVSSHEQSLAGALFQTMTQIGTALGVTVTTIVFNKVVQQESRKLGVIPDVTGDNAPRPALLKGYKSAQWAAFAFGILAASLAFAFLRGVGIVGYQKHHKVADSERTVTNSPSREGT